MSGMYHGRYVPWPVCTMVGMYHGRYVPWPVCTITVCTMVGMYHGRYVPWSVCTMVGMYRGRYVPWSVCTMVGMYNALSVRYLILMYWISDIVAQPPPPPPHTHTPTQWTVEWSGVSGLLSKVRLHTITRAIVAIHLNFIESQTDVEMCGMANHRDPVTGLF